MAHRHIGIAGAGLSGAVIARQLADRGGFRLTVFEPRDHIAGNCHTERDARTGVMNHTFGAHIFHTSREDVWNYVNRFATFRPYVARLKAVTPRGVFSLPINLLTINQFFGRSMRPDEAREFLESKADTSIDTPRNLEEQALRFVGRELYEAFFEGYTRKMWGVHPRQLPASVLARLPVRFSYDDNYFSDRFQGIPEEGYTELVRRLLDHPAIETRLGEALEPSAVGEFDHVFWSGPLDGFFGYRLGRLGYRTLTFERIDAEGDYQGGPVVTYTDEAIPYNRVFEYKHLTPWEQHDLTCAFKQFSKATEPGDLPYYPLRLANDKALLWQYAELANQQSQVTFVGRLGTYRYLDMHVCIGEALDTAARFVDHDLSQAFPAFSRPPEAPPLETTELESEAAG